MIIFGIGVNDMTLDEMAKTLGVSKSTVSRALSGKGRIGEETRQRILSFAEQHRVIEIPEEEQEGNGIGNIGVILPADIYVNGNPYFMDCLLGICETASVMDYNVLVTAATTEDISGISKLVEQQKVDGIILTRSLQNDKAAKYLTDIQFPAAMTGLCDHKEIIQVDTDNELASENMASVLIGKGFRKFALIVEDMSYRVNRKRYDGFCNALMKNGLSKERQIIYTGSLKAELLDAMLDNIMAHKVECIICGDDVVCTRIMSRLQAKGYKIPKDIAIAALYDSQNLHCFTPAVTAVNVMGRQVGNIVAQQIIHHLQNRKYEQKTMVDHEILLRKSTNRV